MTKLYTLTSYSPDINPKALTLMFEVSAECAVLFKPTVAVRARKWSLPCVSSEVAYQWGLGGETLMTLHAVEGRGVGVSSLVHIPCTLKITWWQWWWLWLQQALLLYITWGTVTEHIYYNASSSSYTYLFTIPLLILHLTLDLYILPQCLQGMERVCAWVGRWARAWESSLKVLWHRQHSNWRREEWDARWRKSADRDEKVLPHSPQSSPSCSVDQCNTQLARYSVKIS